MELLFENPLTNSVPSAYNEESKKNAEKKRVTERESNREEPSPAESGSGRRFRRSAFRSGRVSA